MFPYSYTNPSIISRSLQFLKTIKWSSLLDGTGKTLGVINQAIPIVYQVKPLLGNAKTLFKIANGIQEPETNSNTTTKEEVKREKNSPIFYI